MEGPQFRQALERLVTDGAYRMTLESNPQQLLRDYQLTPGEVGLLAAVREAATEKSDVEGYNFDPNSGEDWEREGCICCY